MHVFVQHSRFVGWDAQLQLSRFPGNLNGIAKWITDHWFRVRPLGRPLPSYTFSTTRLVTKNIYLLALQARPHRSYLNLLVACMNRCWWGGGMRLPGKLISMGVLLEPRRRR